MIVSQDQIRDSIKTISELIHNTDFNRNPEDYYLQLINKLELTKVKYYFPWEIQFFKPINNTTKYFKIVITNTIASFINNFHELFLDAETAERKYLLHQYLNHIIPNLLDSIGNIIKQDNLDIQCINPKSDLFFQSNENKNKVYCIQYLKTSLISLYLNLQETYKELIDWDLLETEDIFIQFLKEQSPENNFLILNPKDNISIEQDDKKETIEENPYKLPLGDFREAKKGVFPYDVMVSKKSNLQRFEELLINEEYLNTKLDFIGKHGTLNKLAMMLVVIYEKKYFRNFDAETKTKLESRHIAKFIEHRYNVSIAKQFNTFLRKTQEVDKFAKSDPVILNLPKW